SEEHTSELQSLTNLVCRLLLEKKKRIAATPPTMLNQPPAYSAGTQPSLNTARAYTEAFCPHPNSAELTPSHRATADSPTASAHRLHARVVCQILLHAWHAATGVRRAARALCRAFLWFGETRRRAPAGLEAAARVEPLALFFF